MLKCNHIENFSILLIDKNKEFSSKLSINLKQYGYNVMQAFSEKEAFEKVNFQTDKIGLIVCNIDLFKSKKNDFISKIEKISDIKIIILSEENIGSKRESYFKQGVLDYHIISDKIHHLSDDIHQAIQGLNSNKYETLLIMESSKVLSHMLQTILEKRSYRVLIANNAKEGLEILKDNNITVLILDMELPDVHGLKVLEGLRDLYLLNEFYVLAISSLTDPSLVRDALKGGAKNFLKKPFLYEEFLLKVDLLVQGSRDRQTLSEQKKEIENTLRSFKELLHSTINPMFVFKKNICVDCNTEASELLEVDCISNVLGKHIIDIFKSVSKQHQEELIENKTDHYFEDTILTGSGNRLNVQVKERNIIIDRKLLKIISIMDITEIKRNEKIIAQQSKMASMGEMIGNIAHQWRQPLTAISVAASGIKLNYELDMEDKEETLLELDHIVQNTRFLSDTIEDFQNYLKNNREITQFFIGQVIQKTLSIIHANLESKDIKVVQNIKNDIQVEGVQNDLMQVLLNVINNSVDALKNINENLQKLIYIDLQVTEKQIVINVCDSGGGIAEEIMDKIFDPYFTTKHQSQGTGLGLYMTHTIIEKIGGMIDVKNDTFDVENSKYFGAKFSITIPLVFA